MLLEQSRVARRGPNDGSRPGTGGQRGDGGDRPITTNSNSQRGSPSRFPMSQVPSDRGSAYPMPSGLSSGLPSFTSEGFTDRLTSQIPPHQIAVLVHLLNLAAVLVHLLNLTAVLVRLLNLTAVLVRLLNLAAVFVHLLNLAAVFVHLHHLAADQVVSPIPLLFQLLHNLQHIADRYLLANPYLVVESDKFKPAHSFP